MIKDVLADKETYSVKTSPDGRGNDIHKGMITNDQITKSEFCVSCHQVAVNLGIKLEVVWDQHRDSPARKAGVTLPGLPHGQGRRKKAEGYATAPSAVVGGKEINPGASTPITASSGRAIRSPIPASSLNKRTPRPSPSRNGCSSTGAPAGALPKFEDKVADGKIKVAFPKRWADAADREDARAIIEANLEEAR